MRVLASAMITCIFIGIALSTSLGIVFILDIQGILQYVISIVNVAMGFLLSRRFGVDYFFEDE